MAKDKVKVGLGEEWVAPYQIHSFPKDNRMRGDVSEETNDRNMGPLFEEKSYGPDPKDPSKEVCTGVKPIGWDMAKNDGIVFCHRFADVQGDQEHTLEAALAGREQRYKDLEALSRVVPSYVAVARQYRLMYFKGNEPLEPVGFNVNASSRLRALPYILSKRADWADFTVPVVWRPWAGPVRMLLDNLKSNDATQHVAYSVAGYVAAAIELLRQGYREADVGRAIGIPSAQRTTLQKVCAIARLAINFPALDLERRIFLPPTQEQDNDKKWRYTYKEGDYVHIKSALPGEVLTLLGQKKKDGTFPSPELAPKGEFATPKEVESYFAQLATGKPTQERHTLETIRLWADNFKTRPEVTASIWGLLNALLAVPQTAATKDYLAGLTK